MENSYSLSYSGKNIFTIDIDGVSYSKRFSGNWDGKNHLQYLKDNNYTNAEALNYLNNTSLTLYPVDMNSYSPFIKTGNSIYQFEVNDNILVIKGSDEVDIQYSSDCEDNDSAGYYSFNYDDYIYDYIDDDGIRHVSEDSGNCDGCFYFNITTYYPISEETDFYFRTITDVYYFKGVDKNGKKILFMKSSSFLEDFSLTESFKEIILSTWGKESIN